LAQFCGRALQRDDLDVPSGEFDGQYPFFGPAGKML
jgi:hypothetical protein